MKSGGQCGGAHTERITSRRTDREALRRCHADRTSIADSRITVPEILCRSEQLVRIVDRCARHAGGKCGGVLNLNREPVEVSSSGIIDNAKAESMKPG